MTVAISKALEEGAKAVVCASTGNTSASAAAYAVRAGMTPNVLIPDGKIAGPKLAQAMVHGGRIVAVDGTFDDCLQLARALAATSWRWSTRSTRIDWPVRRPLPSKSSTTSGMRPSPRCPWKRREYLGILDGVSEMRVAGPATRCPRMWGFQAAGAAPIVRGEPVAKPDDCGQRHPDQRPRCGTSPSPPATSPRMIDEVTDEQILVAQQELSSHEGLFVEPASAAGVAGLVAATASGKSTPARSSS